MEDTCIKDCIYYKKYMKKQQCPFYIQTTWTDDSNQPKLIHDCAPKRSLLLQMDAFNRMQGLQISFEQERNKSAKNIETMYSMAQAFQQIISNDVTEAVLIEDNNE